METRPEHHSTLHEPSEPPLSSIPAPPQPGEVWGPSFPGRQPCKTHAHGELEFCKGIRVAPAFESVADLRHDIARLLERWGSGGLAETVEQLLSEVVTNAIQHCPDTSPIQSDWIHVTLCQSRNALTVNVEDSGTDVSSVRSAGHPTPDAESGRGLMLLESLAYMWGTHRTQHGKTVWFILQRPQARSHTTEKSAA
ncbi:ATP-binding protein [Streptomyces sp. NBC_00879]|uniref:ATP-binding protein n=1 Tax=Streptomyces sp. NBC_00879 TaxID=2975855 RepID=UPI0038695FEC|nr:ATP-binding protein [Streptomyces sp. NBC_00879]